MTSPFVGDQRPPENPEPDPALAGFPPPQPYVRPPTCAVAPSRSLRAATGVRTDRPRCRRRTGSRPAYAMPMPPISVVPAPVSALPTEPVPYHQMLRGPRFRWWKPIVTLLLALAIGIPLLMLSFVPLVVMGLATGAAGPRPAPSWTSTTCRPPRSWWSTSA